MQIQLTENQAQNFVNLLDLAVKAGGLQTAAAAAELSNIVVESIQMDQQQFQNEAPRPLEKDELIKEAPPREVSSVDI